MDHQSSTGQCDKNGGILGQPELFKVFDDFERYKCGGLRFIREDKMAHQRSIIWNFMKNVGKSVFSGSLLRISLPVGLCEERSFLQRIPDQWAYLPHFLSKASMIRDEPLERFKNVIAFAVSGLHLTCRMEKPFNPILGETYQGIFSDGSEVYLEQILHHPPVSSWLIHGPGGSFAFSGKGESKAKFSTNSMTVGMSGVNELVFEDGTVIKWRFPVMKISGIIMGNRIVDHVGKWIFQDFTNDLICELEFTDTSKGLYLFRSRKDFKLSDEFTGYIGRHKNDIFLQSDSEVKDRQETLCSVSGSWIDKLEFGGKVYWERDRVGTPEVPRPQKTLLESDCRFREDCIAVAMGDMKKASESKAELEEIQRRDRKLRKHAKGTSGAICASLGQSHDNL